MDFVLGKTFPLGKGCGMTISRRKLRWSKREIEREVIMTIP